LVNNTNNIQLETVNRELIEKNQVLMKNVESLLAENLNLKEVRESNSNPQPNDEVNKYKEFLKRTQEEYKALGSELKKEKEKHKLEVDNLAMKRMETEEKYGKVIKERETFKEKERIFVETSDALTRLNDILKDNNNAGKKDVPIEITGEDETGGSTSKVLDCVKCTYKSSIEDNLNKHKRTNM
jgi:hypothetical protein